MANLVRCVLRQITSAAYRKFLVMWLASVLHACDRQTGRQTDIVRFPDTEAKCGRLVTADGVHVGPSSAVWWCKSVIIACQQHGMVSVVHQLLASTLTHAVLLRCNGRWPLLASPCGHPSFDPPPPAWRPCHAEEECAIYGLWSTRNYKQAFSWIFSNIITQKHSPVTTYSYK